MNLTFVLLFVIVLVAFVATVPVQNDEFEYNKNDLVLNNIVEYISQEKFDALTLPIQIAFLPIAVARVGSNLGLVTGMLCLRKLCEIGTKINITKLEDTNFGLNNKIITRIAEGSFEIIKIPIKLAETSTGIMVLGLGILELMPSGQMLFDTIADIDRKLNITYDELDAILSLHNPLLITKKLGKLYVKKLNAFNKRKVSESVEMVKNVPHKILNIPHKILNRANDNVKKVTDKAIDVALGAVNVTTNVLDRLHNVVNGGPSVK